MASDEEKKTWNDPSFISVNDKPNFFLNVDPDTDADAMTSASVSVPDDRFRNPEPNLFKWSPRFEILSRLWKEKLRIHDVGVEIEIDFDCDEAELDLD